LQGLEEPARRIGFSSDGHGIQADGWVWNAATGKVLVWPREKKSAPREPPEPHLPNATAVAFSPDGRTLVVGAEDYTVRFWDLARQRVFRCRFAPFGATQLTFSPDGLTLLAVCERVGLIVWDTHTGKERIVREGAEFKVSHAAFSADGQTVFILSEDGASYVWELQGGRVETMESKGGGSNWASGPYRVVTRPSETEVQTASGRPLAWFPLAIPKTERHPSGTAWAGIVGNDLCLLQLEDHAM
jgi:WD40 repeat protein